MIKKNFDALLSAIESETDHAHKERVFSDLINAIKETNLIKEKFNELFSVIENETDYTIKFEEFYTLIIAVKGTELMKNHNNRVRSIFLEILSSIEHIQKISNKDLFSDLITLMTGTDMIKENLSEFLAFIKQEKNDKDKLAMFSKFVDTIQENDLMRGIIHELLTAVRDIKNIMEKIRGFSILVKAITDTELVEENSTHFEKLFLVLLTEVEEFPKAKDQSDGLSKLMNATKGTDLIERHFSKLMTAILNIPKEHSKIFLIACLKDLIRGMENFELMEEKFPEIFDIIESMPEESQKAEVFGVLIRRIERTKLFRDKIPDLFVVVENMQDNKYMCSLFISLVKAIKGTEMDSIHFSQIEAIFLKLLSKGEQTRYIKNLIYTIVGPDITSTNFRVQLDFPALLATVEKIQDNDYKLFVFSNLINDLRGSSVIEDNHDQIEDLVSELLTEIDSIPEDQDGGEKKASAIGQLCSSIMETIIMQKKVPAILAVIRNMEKGKIKAYLNLLGAIKGSFDIPYSQLEIIYSECLDKILELIDRDFVDQADILSNFIDAIKGSRILKDHSNELFYIIERLDIEWDEMQELFAKVSRFSKLSELKVPEYEKLILQADELLNSGNSIGAIGLYKKTIHILDVLIIQNKFNLKARKVKFDLLEDIVNNDDTLNLIIEPLMKQKLSQLIKKREKVSVTTKNCVFCGNKINISHKYCANCGVNLKSNKYIIVNGINSDIYEKFLNYKFLLDFYDQDLTEAKDLLIYEKKFENLASGEEFPKLDNLMLIKAIIRILQVTHIVKYIYHPEVLTHNSIKEIEQALLNTRTLRGDKLLYPNGLLKFKMTRFPNKFDNIAKESRMDMIIFYKDALAEFDYEDFFRDEYGEEDEESYEINFEKSKILSFLGMGAVENKISAFATKIKDGTCFFRIYLLESNSHNVNYTI